MLLLLCQLPILQLIFDDFVMGMLDEEAR
uniref:Uncharacterized protein n=1 Tax=Arundo donax TaxID=35708 RepID=A0A0A9F7S2_ARUDO